MPCSSVHAEFYDDQWEAHSLNLGVVFDKVGDGGEGSTEVGITLPQ